MSWLNPEKPKIATFIAKAQRDGGATLSIKSYLREWTWYKTFWSGTAFGIWAAAVGSKNHTLFHRAQGHMAASRAWSALEDEPEKQIPPEIGRLTKLTELDLSGGGFEGLPSSIGNLNNLTVLSVSSNSLKALPNEIGDLKNLTVLNVSSNSLSSLPDEIGNLENLTSLNLSSNPLNELPAEIGKLTNLINLDLSHTYLKTLPPEIGLLKNLKTLNLAGTKLTKLPPEIGRLTKLEMLNLTGFLGIFGRTPLTSPPPDTLAKGTPAIVDYLRDLLDNGRHEWRAKLVIVGEPRAGKTSLLRRLRGEGFLPSESTTRGIEKRSLKLRHPSKDVEMELNTWDFGGQQIYHATHRFFLTDRALFLLVWDSSRDSHLSGKLEYWMESIRARAPGARVVLVATHAEERTPDLRGDLDARYMGMIVGRFAVSNKNELDSGRTALQEKLRTVVADLPGMGELWNGAWLSAAEALAYRTEEYLKPGVMRAELIRYGVTDDTKANDLLDGLHERGDILYFRKEPELNSLVLLKPHWVSEMISRVLDSSTVREAGGLFTVKDWEAIWPGVDEFVCAHLLQLMEKFDLSFPTGLGRNSSSLVVECLPSMPAPYETEWEAAGKGDSARELTLTFDLFGSGGVQLKILPPGVPGWFIARTHRFSTGIHWLHGALLADSLNHNCLGLLRAEEGRVLLKVRGSNPFRFFTELTNVLENTLQRYPGLEIRRTVPCPGHHGKPCRHHFSHERLIELESKHQVEVECGESGERLAIRRLLYGMDEAVRDSRTQFQMEWEARQTALHEALLEEMKSLRTGDANTQSLLTKYHVKTEADLHKIMEGQELFYRMANQQDRLFDQMLKLVGKVDAQTSGIQRVQDGLLKCRKVFQDEFDKAYRRDQATLDAILPRTFSFSPTGGSGWWIGKKLFGQPWELQLFCEQPGDWHPLEEGRYYIKEKPEWMRRMVPYLRYLCLGLRVSLPVATVAVGEAARVVAGITTSEAAAESAQTFMKHLKRMQELTELLADTASSDVDGTQELGSIESSTTPNQGHGEILRNFWRLLAELDGSSRPGGLQKALNREGGQCLWLCDRHMALHRSSKGLGK
jgi:internalin A